MVFTFFIATVVFSGEVKSDGCFAIVGRVAACRDLNGEPRYMQHRSWENITVASPTPHIKPFGPSNYFFHLINGDANGLAPHSALWGAPERNRQSIFDRYVCSPKVWKAPIIRQRTIKQFDIDMILHIPCRGVTSIPPDWSEIPGSNLVRFHALTRGRLETNGNKRSLAGDQSALSYFSGSIGSISAKFGDFGHSFPGNKEAYRSENQERRENGKPFSVFGNSFFGWVRMAWRQATPAKLFVCTLLFSLSCCGVLGAIIYFFDAE